MQGPNDPSPLHVVVIDDNAEHRTLITRFVESAFESESEVCVRAFETASRALAEMCHNDRTVVLCDYRLGMSSGVDWLEDFSRAGMGPVIIVASDGNQRIASEAFRNGAADFMEKSSMFGDAGAFRSRILEVLRQHDLERANAHLSKELKSTNADLVEANKRLKSLAETAQRFVEDVAHEFRTPLAVIMEFASIISDGIGGDITPDQSEYLGHITSAASDLVHLVDDFLDSGKLRAGTLRVDRRVHTLEEIVSTLLPMMQIRAGAKQVAIRTELPDDLPGVYADEEKVRRTICNLVVNAVKFSNSDDEIVIWATKESGGSVRIGVTDHGPGLAPEDVEHLFERFSQAGDSADGCSKGFGLGLSIVRELVAVNLGTVKVESEFGEGCTFSFTLPTSDTEAIIDSYLTRVRERSGSAWITAIAVEFAHACDAGKQGMSFISSQCDARDIVIPAENRNRVLVVTEQSRAPEVFDRLGSVVGRGSNREKARTDELGYELKQIGTWKQGEAKEVLAGLVRSNTEGHEHAQVGAHH